MDVISTLIVAVILSATGFIVHFLRKRRDNLEYFYDALEWLILVTGPLLAGATVAVDKDGKNLFFVAFFVVIMAWGVGWYVTRKDDEKVINAIHFVVGAGVPMMTIGIIYWLIIMA